MNAFLFFTVGLIWCATAVYGADPTPDVALSHPVYRTLDRFEARGWFTGSLSGSRPFSRGTCAQLLLTVLRRMDAGDPVTQTERRVLGRHRREFSVELARLGYRSEDRPSGAGVVRRALRGEDLFAWQDSVASVVVNPLLRQRVQVYRGTGRKEEAVSQTFVGGIVRGTYDRFGFRVRHFEAREWSDLPRRRRSDVLAHPIEDVQLKGKVADFREAAFQLVWATPWFALDAGKALLDWGPGRTGNLLLSSNVAPYGFMRLRAAYGRVRYVHVAGTLTARPGLIDSSRTQIDNGHVRTFLRTKRMSAHRLEILLPKGILLGLQEAVVYGDRGFEFLYVTPVTVLAAAQNHLDNKDNLVMGADLSFRPMPALQVYGALFFDDLMKFSPGAFSNKFAIQAGAFWVDPLGAPNTDLRVEYVRLEPFVYSHNFHINTYEHYDALLGYALGPNADRVFAQATHRFSASFSMSVQMGRERAGENLLDARGAVRENVGGDAQQGRRPEDPAVRDFLAGEVETRTRVGFGIRYEPVRDLVFHLQYQTTGGQNVLLPDGNRGDGRFHRWMATTDWNFF